MILKMEQLSVSYQKNLILDEIGFSLKPHTFTAVLGKMVVENRLLYLASIRNCDIQEKFVIGMKILL